MTDAASLRVDLLNRNQRQVFHLAGRGYTMDEIADLLLMNPRTVKWHLDTIRGLLGIRSKAALGRLAQQYEREHGSLAAPLPRGG